MKTTAFLKYLLLLIPFNVSAHPGHDGLATGFPAAAGYSILVLLFGGAIYAVIQAFRRRPTARADD